MGVLYYYYGPHYANGSSTYRGAMYIFILLSSSDDDDVGTSMEGNFLGGTKNTKKVVHFECGSTQGKWFGGKGGIGQADGGGDRGRQRRRSDGGMVVEQQRGRRQC